MARRFCDEKNICNPGDMVEADSVKEAEYKAIGEFMSGDDYLPGDMVIECTVDLDESEES